jgi:hypothetical protein
MSFKKYAQENPEGISIQAPEGRSKLVENIMDQSAPGDMVDFQSADAQDVEEFSELNVSEENGDLEGEITIQEGDKPAETKEFHIKLPEIPGSDDQMSVLSDILQDEVVVEDEGEKEKDPWSWTVPSFLDWIQQRMQAIPHHSGQKISGVERAMAYLERIDREISKAVRADFNGEIPIDAIDQVRDEIYDGLDRLKKRLDLLFGKMTKKTKKASVVKEAAMTKEATGTHTVCVPVFIDTIARICINSMVSAGKDIEDVFHALVAKFKLDDREQLSLIQVLSDKGYVVRRPRGYLLDEEIDQTSTDNFDWGANYPA